ncbi:acylphosphatase [Pleionea sp. CnH1-48]|uniref:acylphosphatase n=1 Tax=Pleionea sp. CnH1-48 TaxID=2954494 RepID=UPI0020973928|nr:acylphosphatase [Pleionea sp. CnH1-48]MCO7225544.1 acylphosphatase [Pleionea sp. CnH1-48]
MNNKHLHAYVSGKVQGVWFRASTQEKARQLGLTGWVRNLSDGRVEWLASGAEEQQKQLLEWSHQGPRNAVVKEVIAEWREDNDSYNDFEMWSTV